METADKWDTYEQQNTESLQELLEDLNAISNFDWPGDLEMQTTKAAVMCLRDCIDLNFGSSKGIFRGVLVEGATSFPASMLNSVVALNSFDALRPVLNKKEAEGKSLCVKLFEEVVSTFNTKILTRISSALDSFTAGPLDRLREKWDGMLISVRVVERAIAFGGHSPEPAELDAALQALAALDVAADLKVVVDSSSASLQIQRAEALKRSFSAATVIGKSWHIILKEVAVGSEAVISEIAKLRAEETSLQLWLSSNKEVISSINMSWFASTQGLERILVLTSNLARSGTDMALIRSISMSAPIHQYTRCSRHLYYTDNPCHNTNGHRHIV